MIIGGSRDFEVEEYVRPKLLDLMDKRFKGTVVTAFAILMP